jgi:hypothetical protein
MTSTSAPRNVTRVMHAVGKRFAVSIGIYPIVTFVKQLLNMIEHTV